MATVKRSQWIKKKEQVNKCFLGMFFSTLPSAKYSEFKNLNTVSQNNLVVTRGDKAKSTLFLKRGFFMNYQDAVLI